MLEFSELLGERRKNRHLLCEDCHFVLKSSVVLLHFLKRPADTLFKLLELLHRHFLFKESHFQSNGCTDLDLLASMRIFLLMILTLGPNSVSTGTFEE